MLLFNATAGTATSISRILQSSRWYGGRDVNDIYVCSRTVHKLTEFANKWIGDWTRFFVVCFESICTAAFRARRYPYSYGTQDLINLYPIDNHYTNRSGDFIIPMRPKSYYIFKPWLFTYSKTRQLVSSSRATPWAAARTNKTKRRLERSSLKKIGSASKTRISQNAKEIPELGCLSDNGCRFVKVSSLLLSCFARIGFLHVI